MTKIADIKKSVEKIRANNLSLLSDEVQGISFLKSWQDSKRYDSIDAIAYRMSMLTMTEQENFIKYVINEYGAWYHRFLLKHPKLYGLKIFKRLHPILVTDINFRGFSVINFRGEVYSISEYRGSLLIKNV